LFEIRIIKDDVRALASKFKSDRLQIGLRRCYLDLSSDQGASSERNLLDNRVFGERLPDGVAYRDPMRQLSDEDE
jgi:hypothetical protein